MREYYKNQNETREAIEIDKAGTRWLHTGDIGYVDTDGFVFVTGRIKRIYATVFSSPEKEAVYKIFPDYVSQVIGDLQCVKNCAVICIPDTVRKNIAVAFICLKDHAYKNVESEIKQYCARKLPEHSIPKEFRFVNDIPITSIGKIDYHALEREAQHLHEREMPQNK